MNGLTLFVSIVCASSLAAAQSVPPRMIEVPRLPRVDGAPDAVEVQIVVETDGHAVLDACEYAEVVCAAAAEAILAGRFEPATRDDQPIRARVGVRLEFEEAPEPVPPERSPERELGVTAVVEQERGARQLRLAEARDMPGAMGDPLRAALVLPGVVPLLDGLPFFYLRGAPPSGTVYYFDGIPLPALFHMAPGASVVHPRMLGDMQIVSGVPSARYGRFTGGVVIGDGPPPLEGDIVGEGEVRLTDVSAYAHARLDDFDVAVAARYGFPGLITQLFIAGLDMQWADYQIRARLRVNAHERAELVWLGSYDVLSTNSYIGLEVLSFATTTLLFHRGELRYIAERGNLELGAALRLGLDEGNTIGTLDRIEVDAASGGARTWLTLREENFRLHLGAEQYGYGGDISGPGLTEPHPILGLVRGHRQRIISAAYGELNWRPWSWLGIDAGIRTDIYTDPGAIQATADPRVRISWLPDRAVTLHAAFGLAHQPAIYVLPLAALNELPSRDRGVQDVIQSEVGVSVRARRDDVEMTLDIRGYLHRFENMVLEDFIDTHLETFCDMFGYCREIVGDLRLDYTTWGAELDARAALGRHFSARLSYTLGFLDAEPFLDVVEYTPSQDVRHVFNLVLVYDSRDGFTAGIRAFLRDGEVRGWNSIDEMNMFVRIERRLPWWGRLDANIAYAWDAGWARLRVSLDWVNVLFALGGPPLDLSCDTAGCAVVTGPAYPLPSLGMRGTFQ